MFIFKDTKKRGPAYPASTPYVGPDGTQHPGTPLELLYEVPEPEPPADYSEDTYFRIEQDEAPYVVYLRKSDEQVRAAKLAKLIPLSPRQLRQALTRAGIRAQVEAAVAASDQDTKDWYEWATSFERTHPKILEMLPALGVTEEQADAVWTLGATL